jgi:PERQ amino acid-rich with GYF domain-containing protein
MGTFGNFSLGSSVNAPTPVEKRQPFGRGESRLTHLMPKESSEDIAAKAADRPWRTRQRTDTDPFSDEAPSGSAALEDTSPLVSSQHRTPGTETPIRGTSGDFGMSEMPGFRDAVARAHLHQTPQGRHEEREEPMSPSDTNPYRSPPDDRHNTDEGSYDGESLQHGRMQGGLGGIPEHSTNTFGTLPRGFQTAAFDGSDRSQTSSVGAGKGFPPLGGLSSIGGMGNLSGWPTSANPIGTPDRERAGFPSAFGSSLFGPMGELQSPSLGGLGNMFGSGPPPNASVTTASGRGSKLGSLFPAAMQAQMQGIDESSGDMRSNNAFGAIGRNAFPPSRDTDSPLRAGRHPFEDLFPPTEGSRNQAFSTSENVAGQTASAFSQTSTVVNYQQSQASSDSASNQVPTAQQRMMVMPDRMRWVYLDPQGQVQGPWSGLEMHDWYKASFFTADLSVRKLEDSEFEPLGQLIRRIGNSREPFLVPQIGIPHGPPPPPTGTAFTPAAAGPAGAQPGAVQPPFAGAFPSFGTTLTAEQQNNLERRKQEEQFLMARQREFLAQQQVNMKQMQMGGHPSALHHHSSAHSLQSQPSFGSMTSPIGMPPQPPMPSASSFFDIPPRQIPQQPGSMPFDNFREDELARLTLQDRQQLFNATIPGPQQSSHAQQITSIFGQLPDSQRQAARLEQNDPQGFRARLREFEQYRAQHDLEESFQSNESVSNEPIGPSVTQRPPPQQQFHEEPELKREEEPEPQVPEILSLTQQVQKAASAKQSPVVAPQPESPWGKVANTGLPMPFPPPPQSTTPLPAPTAQRGRSNLPEALNVEPRSRSETPDVASVTPSIAPWAKETVEAPKGPSLKEIQEAEAKKAAKQEEIAAAARRANLEQEMKMLATQQAAPAPGLPTSSTWGNSASPATPTNATSVWAKPAATKVLASSTSAAAKKTLADIQREEELRKQKLAAAAAASQPSAGPSAGKRYADLASKSTPPLASVGGSAWSTVGAGGKVKIPTGPAAAAPPAVRSVSSANVATSAARPVRPAPATRSVTTSGQSNIAIAKEEFNKWAKATLSRGLNPGINGMHQDVVVFQSDS